MNRINFGKIKAGLFNILTESLDKTDELSGSNCIDFFKIVKNNPFL